MDKEALVKRLMATFLEELAEHVATLNRDLLALAKGAAGPERAERLQTLFRTVHSLKGAARAVNVTVLESACHHLEGMLAAARDGTAELGPEQFALLFAAADAIEEAGMRLREQRDLTDSPLAELLPRLGAAGAGAAAPSVSRVTPKPPPPPPAGDTASAPAPPPAPGTVRISAEKLDQLLACSGELLLARRRVQARAGELTTLHDLVTRWRPASASRERTEDDFNRLVKELDRLTEALAGDVRALRQAGNALDDEVRRVRMLPFAEACQGLDRLVHDLARSAGKEVELVIEGGDVELDRSVLEGMRDPLRHLVRNAVDHGVEPPEQRRAAGKRPAGRVTIAAVLRGSQVQVTVADDGRGLDLEALRQQARKRGLPEAATEAELVRQIFLPGFSTARLITDVSGRGVGLDVVKSRLEALHGTVELSFTPGQGTRFTLAVPLTLTTLRALLLGAAGQTFALASTNVRRLVRVEPAHLRSVEGRPMLALGGPPLPVASLAGTLGLTGAAPQTNGKVPAVVVTAGTQTAAFLVDELVNEQEVVIKNLGARIRRVRHLSGATILPSGEVTLVLNAAALIRAALAAPPGAAVTTTLTRAAPAAKKRVLVVDDSVTTRALEKSILEAAGYEVTAAADGAAAWQLLQDRGADLVVSDVEMPRLDGFALTAAVRGSRRFRELPVVLVTGRESDQDRARGIEVGADAYLVKSAFDQTNLLQTIAQLL
jgi:two-component system chemotaxis sensor kinase CheA